MLLCPKGIYTLNKSRICILTKYQKAKSALKISSEQISKALCCNIDGDQIFTKN